MNYEFSKIQLCSKTIKTFRKQFWGEQRLKRYIRTEKLPVIKPYFAFVKKKKIQNLHKRKVTKLILC